MLPVPFAARFNDDLERGAFADVFYFGEGVQNRVQRVVIEFGVILERQRGIFGETRDRSD